MLTVHLARSSPPLPTVWSTTRALGLFLASVARWPALAGVFCGVGTSRGGRQKAHHGRTPFSAAQSPLALRVSLPCQRTPVAPSPWPGKHGTCSLPPTGPRRPVLSNSPIAPNPSPIST